MAQLYFIFFLIVILGTIACNVGLAILEASLVI